MKDKCRTRAGLNSLLVFSPLSFTLAPYSAPDLPDKGTNLPILLCTLEAAFNCLYPQTLGAARWNTIP